MGTKRTLAVETNARLRRLPHKQERQSKKTEIAKALAAAGKSDSAAQGKKFDDYSSDSPICLSEVM
jgi:hypothetical protein